MECVRCESELLKVVSSYNTISAITTYVTDFTNVSYTDKYVCSECGYVQEYARNPKVFTDKKYRHVQGLQEQSLEECSNNK